jgi:DNA-binding NarL/FixJ family response regulator
MIFGLLLALASALATNVAFLLKHRGAVLAPPVRARRPLGSAAGLFRSKWFAIGWMVAVVAWLLHVGALSLAPLSIVQAVMSGGIVFLAVLGERYFGFRLGRWQWVGLSITAAGLAVIGFTGGGATRPQRSSLAAMIAVEGAIVAVAATALAISTHRSVLHRAEGLLLGLAAGALFGVSNVAIKFLTHADGPLHGLLSPWSSSTLMEPMDGITATAAIKERYPEIEVVAVTSFVEEVKVHAALQADASGYPLKDAGADEVATAIRAAHLGDVHLDPVARQLTASLRRGPSTNPKDVLTECELEVLRLVAAGTANKEIAAELVISDRTARVHVSNILAKLDLRSRT